MAKLDLTDAYVSEYMEYNRLVLLGASRTSGVSASFASTSSGVTYTSLDGEQGIMGELKN